MALAIMLLVVALLCAIAVIRELKSQNFLGVAFASISTLAFGWFSVMTIYINIVG